MVSVESESIATRGIGARATHPDCHNPTSNASSSLDESVLLTENQLAVRHQRSVKTIRNLRVKGGYVPFLKIGRHVRYRLIDVLAYEGRCLRQSTSDKGGR